MCCETRVLLWNQAFLPPSNMEFPHHPTPFHFALYIRERNTVTTNRPPDGAQCGGRQPDNHINPLTHIHNNSSFIFKFTNCQLFILSFLLFKYLCKVFFRFFMFIKFNSRLFFPYFMSNKFVLFFLWSIRLKVILADFLKTPIYTIIRKFHSYRIDR